MLLSFANQTFYCVSSFTEKDIPKGAGFRWNPDASPKRWETQDASRAARLAQYADERALEALKETGAIDNVRYLALTGSAKKASITTDKKARIEEIAARITDEEIAAIHSMLKLLAGQCDGARKLDDAGFNAMDTNFGHQLAASARLSPRQAAYGRQMLLKYHAQLPAELFELVFAEELQAKRDKEVNKRLERKSKRESKKRGDAPNLVVDDLGLREVFTRSEVEADAELTPGEREEVAQMGERDNVSVTFTATGKCSTCGAPEIDNKRTCEHTPRSVEAVPSASSAEPSATDETSSNGGGGGAQVQVIESKTRARKQVVIDYVRPKQSACPELWDALDRYRNTLAGETEQKRRVLDDAIKIAFEIVRLETRAGNVIEITKKSTAAA